MRRLVAILLAAAAAGEVAQPVSAGRIASFSPAATRILVDLGCASSVVAATRWCELPAAHPAARSCDAFEPDVEALQSARPDLVILPRLTNPLLEQRIRSLGLRTEVLAAESPESPAADIARLGLLCNRETEARRLLAERACCQHPASHRRVLLVWDGTCAGPDSYLAWVIRASGAEVAVPRGGWVPFDIETIAKANPDLVLFLGQEGPASPELARSQTEEWRRTPGLRTTRAASDGCIFTVRAGTDWLPSSGLPRAVECLARIAKSR